MCRYKGVTDTLLEAESVQISRIYGTRAKGSPCLNTDTARTLRGVVLKLLKVIELIFKIFQ